MMDERQWVISLVIIRKSIQLTQNCETSYTSGSLEQLANLHNAKWPLSDGVQESI